MVPVAAFHTPGGGRGRNLQATRCVLGGKSRVKVVTLIDFHLNMIYGKGIHWRFDSRGRGRGKYLILNENGQLVDMNSMLNILNNTNARTVKGEECYHLSCT